MNFVSGLVSKLKSTLGSGDEYKVSEVAVVKFSSCPEVARQDNFVLYRTRDQYTLAVFGYEKSAKNFVLFSIKEEGAAIALYSLLVSQLLPLVQAWRGVWSQPVLQQVCDVVRQRPTWSLAHVCAHLKLHEPLQLRLPMIARHANTPDDTGQTPLHAALIHGDRQVIQELLLIGASIDAVDSQGNNAFHLAARLSPDVLKLLALRPAPCVNALNNAGESPLHLAALADKADCMDVLLLNGANPMHSGSYRYPIHCAVAANSLSCAELLVRRCYNQLSVVDNKYGGTPLHWCRNKQMVECMLSLGADVNALSRSGDTALHVMIRYGRIECVRALLCREAIANVPNHEGKTPLHLAIPVGNANLVRCLLVFGAEVNSPDINQVTPRHLAATCGCKNSDIILHTLHMIGAERCKPFTIGCSPGCATGGTDDGRPDRPDVHLLSEKSQSELWEDLLLDGQSRFGMAAESSLLGDNLNLQRLPGYRVLCLDGGGIRGLILIGILMAIEKETGRPLTSLFDWISGTSTGGILALAIASGKTASFALGMYFRLKDEVFSGSKPYKAERLENVLKGVFGEHAPMIAISTPKVMVTTVVADRHPPDLHIFRNYVHPKDSLVSPVGPAFADPIPGINEVKIWQAARCSGAAPSFFRAALSRFLDGGLASNNPTLDTLTEIQEYNAALLLTGKGNETRPVACVVSLGTGRMPVTRVKDIDLFRPEGVFDAVKAFSGAQSLMRLLVEQASNSEGQPVTRSRAWCNMAGIPFFRFSPPLTSEVSLDETDDEKLFVMMWETMVYLHRNRDKLRRLARVLRRD